MQETSIIRGRGQLTIPDSIRKKIRWATPMSPVSISVIKPNEIVIKPHSQHVDENQVWRKIKRSRAVLGKGKIKTIEFLAADRNLH